MPAAKSDCRPEKILLLGDPALRETSRPVDDFASPGFREDARRLVSALDQFRREHGFGRAIAAPQIGILRRMIAMNLGAGPFLLVNPEWIPKSDRRFTLWDDCMSFPWLMVRLERFPDIEAHFCDIDGKPQHWETVEPAVAELLQHEIDHLDGILAVDRALDKNAIIARELYMERREFFDRQVDYTIVPTMRASSGTETG
ncbi:MAG: peptide deformylase [Acidobacteria bacterium]|nr:peptide deformylase [Acidobacteriota bacterium]